jgi:iron complex transport system substrate-binding protein
MPYKKNSIILLCILLFFLRSFSLSADEVRIVSLSPALTEIITILGKEANIVGHSESCVVPHKKSITAGSPGYPNNEVVIKLAPDVIVCDMPHPAANWQILQKNNIKTYIFETGTIENYSQTVRQLGKILNCGDRAEEEVKRFNDALANALKTTVPAEKEPPAVLFLLGINPPVSCGKGTFIDQLITLAGAKNIVGEYSGYFVISEELIAKSKIDILFLTDMVQNHEEAKKKLLASKQKIPSLKIVDSDIFCRLSPRTPEAAAMLKKELSDLQKSRNESNLCK